MPLGGPVYPSLNAACHKEQQYVWFIGGYQNSFQDIMHFMKRASGACPRGSRMSMSLNAVCHKEQQYLWFMGGDLNGFRDITHFMK